MTQLRNAQYTVEHVLNEIERCDGATDIRFIEKHLNYVLNCLDDARCVYEADLVAQENVLKEELREDDIRQDYRLDEEYSHQDIEHAAEEFSGSQVSGSEVL